MRPAAHRASVTRAQCSAARGLLQRIIHAALGTHRVNTVSPSFPALQITDARFFAGKLRENVALRLDEFNQTWVDVIKNS